MSLLLSPWQIRQTPFRNRIAVSPMCMYSSQDGFANDWHLVHLGSRAVGGAGLVLTEATAVAPEGRITPFDLGIWKDEHIDFLRRITDFIGQQGAVPGIQLAHAGRKASHARLWEGGAALQPADGGWEVLAPSPLPYQPERAPQLRAMEPADIQQVIDQFRRAAERALAAGFVVAEIHAAHGYLLHEFYSPASNRREDEYGGSFDNRIRLLLEVTAAVRGVWPKGFPLFVRISATDWAEGGWTADDSVRLAGALQPLGVDLIDCSSGGNISGVRIEVRPGYQVPFAARIKRETGLLSGAVGLITEPRQAEAILARGEADLILLAREMLRDPYFALHAAQALGERAAWPAQYERAAP